MDKKTRELMESKEFKEFKEAVKGSVVTSSGTGTEEEWNQVALDIWLRMNGDEPEKQPGMLGFGFRKFELLLAAQSDDGLEKFVEAVNQAAEKFGVYVTVNRVDASERECQVLAERIMKELGEKNLVA